MKGWWLGKLQKDNTSTNYEILLKTGFTDISRVQFYQEYNDDHGNNIDKGIQTY